MTYSPHSPAGKVSEVRGAANTTKQDKSGTKFKVGKNAPSLACLHLGTDHVLFFLSCTALVFITTRKHQFILKKLNQASGSWMIFPGSPSSIYTTREPRAPHTVPLTELCRKQTPTTPLTQTALILPGRETKLGAAKGCVLGSTVSVLHYGPQLVTMTTKQTSVAYVSLKPWSFLGFLFSFVLYSLSFC